MPKYHLTKDGRIARCMAFFKTCPLQQHFNSQEEGERYISRLEDNRIKYPDLIDEDILLPENSFLLEIEKMKNKEICRNLYVTKDSFVIVQGEEFDKEAFHSKMKSFIADGVMAREDVARGISNLKSYEGRHIGDEINRKTKFSAMTYSRSKEEGDKMFIPSTLRSYDELVKEKNNNITEIATAFNYIITDRVLDKGTKIRIFTRPEPIKYDFDTLPKIEGNSYNG